MRNFKVHTFDTVDQEAKSILEEKQKAFGFVPNLIGTLVESPQLAKAYDELHELFTNSSFNSEELTVVWQTINVENECHYCVPAHTAIANAMNIDSAITEALRNETPLQSEKLEALRTFTLQMIRKRGFVSDEDLNSFYAAGYTHRNVLDVILGLAQKTISNYTNHVSQTPLDKNFQSFKWEKEATV
ncbi:carboxymuconolactone decarboxylase family protein [Flammeovirga agarivorans]|uniref:Carboxymuconolactone decarboxylase family protein n=1 Tax=Flammeovirga agarivorans TaxID=2726742 RepID=A0A7X8XVN7_9BACT|nr:carboxymuconolactone decarboxylase family protein [Flammeovirga agarivorans]NLR91517.1 carboxymuconolactone decarboxylase family protein [Flammeovirga agarivorans]